MRFEVALFAYHRERHGSAVTIDAEPTVEGILGALAKSGIDVRTSRLAVDESIAGSETKISPTSRIALIPPVSGG